jgi:hypothetical protein
MDALPLIRPQQDAHLQRLLAGSKQMGPGFFEHRDNLSFVYGREIIKEVINSVASLQIVNQGLKRYTSSDEHRRAAENFGIGMYDGVHRAQSYPAAPSASKQPRHFLTILIPSARQIDHDDLIFPQCRSQFRRLRKGMGGFQSR